MYLGLFVNLPRTIVSFIMSPFCQSEKPRFHRVEFVKLYITWFYYSLSRRLNFGKILQKEQAQCMKA